MIKRYARKTSKSMPVLPKQSINNREVNCTLYEHFDYLKNVAKNKYFVQNELINTKNFPW